MKRKTKLKIVKSPCVIKYISENLDKQLRALLNDNKKKDLKNKDKISYVWITDNVEVRLKK